MRVIVSYLKYVGFAVIGLCFLAIPVSLLLFYLHNGYMPSVEENAFLAGGAYSGDLFFSAFMCHSVLLISLLVTFVAIVLESFVQGKLMLKSFLVWFMFIAMFLVLFLVKIQSTTIAQWLWD